MTSTKQIEANKKNAQKGGVKTIEGKVISSKNSYKHGLTSKQFASLDEREIYKKILQSICRQYEPFDMMESMLCERIALCYTKLLRIVNIETSEIEKCNLNTELEHLKKNKPMSVEEEQYVIEKPRYSTPEAKTKITEIQRKESIIQGQLINIEKSCLPILILDALEKLEGYEAKLENRLYRAIKELKAIQNLRGLIRVDIIGNVNGAMDD